MRFRSSIAILFALAIACSGTAVDTAGMTAAVRRVLEAKLQESSHVGFSSFQCDIDDDIAPGDRFECSAVTDDGDRMDYSIGIDEEGGASVVLASQPASQLSAEDRAILGPPCRAFLDDFNAEDWSALYASFHQALKEAVTADAARAMLEPVRRDLGAVRNATLVTDAVNESGRHELVYALECEHGPGDARFGVVINSREARLVAFLITPANGSLGQARMLKRVGRETLAKLIGEPVVRIDAPFEQLLRVGDAVEGTAWLGDGTDLAIRAEQYGRKDDFDPIDYRFQVLDVPWLLRHMLENHSARVESVDCPRRVPADGAVVTCSAVTSDGPLTVTMKRQGGNYRVLESSRSDDR